MKYLQTAILALATAMLAYLLWKVDAGAVWRYVSQVGLGMLLLISQELVAHSCNAMGWRCAFPPFEARAYKVRELLKLRIAGDGINYLTPSGTIAGEFMRVAWLNDSHGSEVRYASVAVAKFTQALGQALFILLGLLVLVNHSDLLQSHQAWIRALTAALIVALALVAVTAAFIILKGAALLQAPASEEPKSVRAIIRSVPRQCLTFIRDYPNRFAFSTLWFSAGFAWGGFEAYWICKFLGVPVSIKTAVTIEVLSNLIDGTLFMVPAKVGTQEAGKTAIFAALRLSPTAGFAFGVVRHIRELFWAATGLALSSTLKRRTPPTSVPPLPAKEPV